MSGSVAVAVAVPVGDTWDICDVNDIAHAAENAV